MPIERSNLLQTEAVDAMTEHQEADEALIMSEECYRDLVENSGLFVGTHDTEGRILSVNQSVLDFLGLDRSEEIIGRRISDFLPERNRPLFQTYLNRVLKEGKMNGAASFVSPKGDKITLEYTNSLRRDPLDSVVVRCLGRDVTEQYHAETALHESERKLRFALEVAGLTPLDWKIESDQINLANRPNRITGSDSIGLADSIKRFHPEDREEIGAKINHAISNRENFSHEFRILNPDGQVRWVEAQARLLSDPDGRPVRFVGVIRDVTDKRRIEADNYRAQRLESIGALASGIAHDLNNVLAPILMALHALEQRFSDETSRRWISLIYRSAERGRDLIEQMIAFAKGASGERTLLPLNLLVEDLNKILRETLPKNVELETYLPDDLWSVVGDVTQIHQVLMNLCINARDAMPEGGMLSITAENKLLTMDEVQAYPDVQSGRFICITVADTGIGIPAQIIDRIFDPFFTTKEKGKGTGLGLATVIGIVRGHAGFVTVQSEVNRGSQFHVYLPARELSPFKTAETQPLQNVSGHGEMILIVDDEPAICEVVKHTLETNGYRVVAANDGMEALTIYRLFQEEIKVVLTDIVMPNLDGLELIRALKSIDPDLKIVATSGILTTGKLAESEKAGVNVFLPKPFPAEKLLSAIARVLNQEK